MVASGKAKKARAWLAADRPRPAIALALWGVVPVAFFTFVPTGTTFFFPRYLLPALPFFLLLVVSGCLAFFVFGRVGAFAAGALLAGVLAWQLYDVGVELDVRALQRYLDEYVQLERPGIQRAPEGDPERLAEFVESNADPAVGVWIFAGPPETVATARKRLEAVPGGEIVPVSPTVLVVHSAEPQEPRDLVELAAALREAWLTDVPDDGEAERLLRRDQFALGAS